MKNVSSKYFTDIVDINESGSSVKLLKVMYNKKKYCFRSFYEDFNTDWVMNNAERLTKENFTDEFLKPLYIVDDNKGVLTKFAENTQDLGFICNKYKQIKYLKIAKGLICKLHNEYKYIHGDISASNIIINDEEVKTYLCDFDTTIKFGEIPLDWTWFSDNLLQFFHYYKYDRNVDIYKFNLMTLAVLFNVYECEIFSLIENNELGEFNNEKNIKRLAKELLLLDSRKSYSGEFLIDYIDENKYRY